MSDREELAARLAEIETRFTLQQDVIDKLSEVAWKLQKELDALALRVKELEAKRVTGEGGEVDPIDEPPPHY